MGDKPLARTNSNTWRAWRRTTIRIFVGLNILLVVGFYAATSSFHGGLSHLDESNPHTAGSQDHGRPGISGLHMPVPVMEVVYTFFTELLLQIDSALLHLSHSTAQTCCSLTAVSLPSHHIQPHLMFAHHSACLSISAQHCNSGFPLVLNMAGDACHRQDSCKNTSTATSWCTVTIIPL